MGKARFVLGYVVATPGANRSIIADRRRALTTAIHIRSSAITMNVLPLTVHGSNEMESGYSRKKKAG